MKNNYKHLVHERKSRRYLESKELSRTNGLFLSVADGDWCPPKGIFDDLKIFLNKRDFSYTFCKKSFAKILITWYEEQYGYINKNFSGKNIVIGNGVINFIQLTINAYSNKGDGVIFFSPVYYSFLTSTMNLGRKPIKLKLIYDNKLNKFTMDFVELEKAMKVRKNKIIILCNPHNPIGRNWTKKEMKKIVKLARENNIVVISDEIWQDITFNDRKTVPLVNITNTHDLAISIASFSKTYNLGGTQFGYTLSNNIEMIEKINIQKNKSLSYASDNLLNIVISKSCMTNSINKQWLCDYKKTIWENYTLLKDAISSTKISMPKLEATYLCWLDFSKYNLSKETITKIFEKNHIYLEDGSDFCDEYDSCKRINIAISKEHIKLFIKVLKTNFK